MTGEKACLVTGGARVYRKTFGHPIGGGWASRARAGYRNQWAIR